MRILFAGFCNQARSIDGFFSMNCAVPIRIAPRPTEIRSGVSRSLT